MENSLLFKNFLFLGIHPNRPLKKLHVAVNSSSIACCCLLVLYRAYIDKDLAIVDLCNGLIIVNVKYLGMALARGPIKRMMKAMEHFWDTNIADDKVAYYVRYSKIVEKAYVIIYTSVVLAHAVKPFLTKESSIFNCYVPLHIPVPIFYLFELYTLTMGGSAVFSFNATVASVIFPVIAQFRLANLKIEELNIETENDQDLKEYTKQLKCIIKHQQFLMRFVEDVNKLICVPVALLMASSVTMVCLSLYIRTIYQGSMYEEARFLLIFLSAALEFLFIYGLAGQLLMDESSAIAETLFFECKWYTPKLRALKKDFLVVMMQSQRSVYIRAGNYHIINNRTILLMMKTTYSFYTFLQKVT